MTPENPHPALDHVMPEGRDRRTTHRHSVVGEPPAQDLGKPRHGPGLTTTFTGDRKAAERELRRPRSGLARDRRVFWHETPLVLCGLPLFQAQSIARQAHPILAPAILVSFGTASKARHSACPRLNARMFFGQFLNSSRNELHSKH
jgi:hypothetical protein